jgi:hypothetical protein
MKPAVINWQAFNNEDWPAAITVQLVSGAPFDWTQYSAIVMQIKADALQPEPDAAVALGAGITVRSSDHSTLDVLIAVAAVQDLLGLYVYDIVGTSGGSPTLVVRGSINVSQGVTR